MIEPISLPLAMRLFERMLVVAGGILSVYLGYRLFHIAHIDQSAQGKFKLSSILEFGVSRVGPGVFFALFGAWILYTSLTTPGSFPGPYGPTNVIGEAPPKLPLPRPDSSATLTDAFTKLQERLSKLPDNLQEKARNDMDTIKKSIDAPCHNTIYDALGSLEKQIMSLPEAERESARMAFTTIRSFFGEPDPYYCDSLLQRGITEVPAPPR